MGSPNIEAAGSPQVDIAQLAQLYQAAVSENDSARADFIKQAARNLAVAEAASAEASVLTQFALRMSA
jgi:hypothetical protein